MPDAPWERIERELRRLPRPEAAAAERVLRRIEAEPPPGRAARLWRWLVEGRLVLNPLGAMAGAAALLVAFAAGAGLGGRETETPAQLPGAHALAPGQPAEGREMVQFVFVAGDARRVHLVGDFNDWRPDATPLQRSGDGVWTVVLPLEPGRHTYAFVVDGTTWMADASAPRGPDDEFGTPSSVVLVGESQT